MIKSNKEKEVKEIADFLISKLKPVKKIKPIKASEFIPPMHMQVALEFAEHTIPSIANKIQGIEHGNWEGGDPWHDDNEFLEFESIPEEDRDGKTKDLFSIFKKRYSSYSREDYLGRKTFYRIFV
jgi:hypothetical protein